VIIVHHAGTNTTSDKAGKGSTVFDAWLDGWFKINPRGNTAETTLIRDIDIWSRDSERETVTADFDYPVHKVKPELVAERTAKTNRAKSCILEAINSGKNSEQEVRYHVLGKGHTEYAYWRARKELIDEKKVIVGKAEGAGNRKRIVL
jgi:hypothetical protein